MRGMEGVNIDWWKAWATEKVPAQPPEDLLYQLGEAFERSLFAAGRGSFDYRFALFLTSVGLSGFDVEQGETVAHSVFQFHQTANAARRRQAGPHQRLEPTQ